MHTDTVGCLHGCAELHKEHIGFDGVDGAVVGCSDGCANEAGAIVGSPEVEIVATGADVGASCVGDAELQSS